MFRATPIPFPMEIKLLLIGCIPKSSSINSRLVCCHISCSLMCVPDSSPLEIKQLSIAVLKAFEILLLFEISTGPMRMNLFQANVTRDLP